MALSHQDLPHHLRPQGRQMNLTLLKRRMSLEMNQKHHDPAPARCWGAWQNAILAEAAPEVAPAVGAAEAAAPVDALVQHSEDRCSSS